MNREQRTICKTIWVVVVLFAGSLSATPVAIENAGFETPVLLDGYYTVDPSAPHNWPAPPAVYVHPPIPGWTLPLGQIAGVFNPTGSHFPSEAPAGQNVAYINLTGYFSQTLAATLAPSTVYTLTVSVGNRWDSPGGRALDIGTYGIELLAGGTVLAEDDNSLSPADGEWLTSTISFVSLPGNPLLGQPLEIRFSQVGSVSPAVYHQVNFDDVRLDASPIPAPGAVLLGTLGVGLVGWLRRRRTL
ncbi:MAG: hypothetical protein FJ280_04195 [Planctomycetes bacterium]|nr:hypothetical protein [Planctomycetota bacterium]